MGSLLKDFVLAARSLRRSPLTSLLVILTLALGIAVNSVVFSGVNTLLLNPLPYADADRLVLLSELTAEGAEMSASVPNFNDWRRDNRLLSHFGGFLSESFDLSGGDQPERIDGAWISAESLPAFGISPQAGRFFTPDEDRFGGPLVAVVGHSLWQRRFGDQQLGEQWLTLDGRSYQVVGVLPPASLPFPDDGTEVWLPLDQLLGYLSQDRGFHPGLYALGKLPEGVALSEARSEMAALARNLAAAFPDTNAGQGIEVTTLRERAVEEGRPFLLLLAAAVALVLLIACFNVMSLLLARGSERRKEVALKSALGAGRAVVGRQLLVESTLLAVLGGALGLLLASWGLRMLVAAIPPELAVRDRLGIDGAVLAFTAVVALGTGLLCGLAPAWGAARTDLRGVLSEGGGRAGGLSRRWVRNGLVVLELTTALTLLTGAGLAIHSAVLLARAEPGFEAADVLTLRLDPPLDRYRELRQWEDFYDQLLAQASALPGVRSAGIGTGLPLVGGGARASLFTERNPPAEGAVGPLATYQVVSPDFLPALGVELVAGRLPNTDDQATTPAITVVDEKLAALLWPDTNPLGQRLSFESAPGEGGGAVARWREVVGVVRAVPFAEPEEEPLPAFYLPHAQPPLWYQGSRPPMTLVVRAEGTPLQLVGPVRQEVRRLDADLPVYRVATLESRIAEELLGRRLTAQLMGVFAVLALILALVGIYGVLSYAVTQRRHEVGVRMALGARKGQVLGLILRQAGVLIAIGLGLGALASFGVSTALAGVLYGISGWNPTLVVGLALLLGTAALLASFLPARRATRVEPVETLGRG